LTLLHILNPSPDLSRPLNPY